MGNLRLRDAKISHAGDPQTTGSLESVEADLFQAVVKLRTEHSQADCELRKPR